MNIGSMIEEKPGVVSSRRVIIFILTGLVVYITIVFARVTLDMADAMLGGEVNPNAGVIQSVLTIGWPLIIGSIVAILTTLQWMKYIEEVGAKARAPGTPGV